RSHSLGCGASFVGCGITLTSLGAVSDADCANAEPPAHMRTIAVVAASFLKVMTSSFSRVHVISQLMKPAHVPCATCDRLVQACHAVTSQAITPSAWRAYSARRLCS